MSSDIGVLEAIFMFGSYIVNLGSQQMSNIHYSHDFTMGYCKVFNVKFLVTMLKRTMLILM